MHLTTKLLTTLLLGSAVSSAHAISTVAADYNVFVFGDFTSSNTDIEGNLAAGGNVSLQSYAVASNISGSSARLVADGNVTASNGGVGNGQNGSIYAASTTLSSFTATGGIFSQSQVDFAAAQSQLQSLSTSWAALAANGSTAISYGTLSLNGTNTDLNVFTVSGNDLTNTNSVNINAIAGSTVLINVTGSGQTFQNGQVFLTGVDAAHVLYNFGDATALSLAGSKNPFGTVFAPFANISGGYGALDGQLIAQSFNGNIEFHNVLFTGNLPTSVPLPAASWLFGSALLGLVASMARKKRQI